ncbi:MAG: hypothetical protein GXY55_00175 [Phycisphaerae bacterium]|nr:hypothetical protein [Phycisphaerae bacterium]
MNGGITAVGMARYANPNPQDRVFFAYDRALKRLGLPGILIQVHLCMRGPIDVEGLRRTLPAIYRLYPATAARLEQHPITGNPRWRLDVPEPDPRRVVRVHQLAPATQEEFHRRTEELLREPLELTHRPPVQFHIFRGLPKGDIVTVRWPHAFMDVRGSTLLLEDIDELYRKPRPLADLSSLGDERRQDFESLTNVGGLREQWRTLTASRGQREPRPPHDLFLPSEPIRLPLGRIRHTVRLLTPDQTRQTQEASLRVCGFARFGDFVRATALRALHRVMGDRPRAGDTYSTLNLLDHRKRRQRGPVCQNFFSGLPMRVPVALADNRRAVADEFHRQTEQIVASGGIVRHLLTVRTVARLPIAALADAMYLNMRPDGASALPVALGTPPSIQVGFSGASPTASPTFCGATWDEVYGIGIPPPLSGFAVDLNLTGERLHLTATYYETRIPSHTMDALMDDLAASLQDPT